MTRLFVLLLVFFLPSALTAQENGGEAENLGKVHFPISCTPAAQQQFDRALAMLHSFWFPQSTNAFSELTKMEPDCAMAYWGIAISRRANPLAGAPESKAVKDGFDAIEKAKALGGKTERERDYIRAMDGYYAGWEKLDYRTRVLAYEKAIGEVYLRYPQDPEAAIFYALAMDEAVTVLPADKNYRRQLEAAAILEKVLALQPDHPGALHYLIHSYDFPALANRGVDAARRYGGVAPSAPHALHVPSHIFSMLGMWQESIASNRAALTVAKNYVHAMDFMVYAYLQEAQDDEAKRVVDQSAALEKSQTPLADVNPTGATLVPYTAFAAIPARYAIERGDWVMAAALPLRPTTPAADAITYFTRAMGSARSGDLPAARKNIEQLQMLQDALARSNQDYWAEQVMIQRNAAAAWVAYGEGRAEEAVQLMRIAADHEDASEKHIAMENRLWPMRELLGELLLNLNRPAQALKEFETSLQVARNRYRGLYGAAKAALKSGDRPKARSYYQRLILLCSHAGSPRPEFTEAKTFLAEKGKELN